MAEDKCPMCGGKDRVYVHSSVPISRRPFRITIRVGTEYYASCTKCGCLYSIPQFTERREKHG